MKDIPGFVHNATASTALSMAQKMEMDPSKSIWGDFGCGAPIFAIQGGVFAKQTLCVDLPTVINQVLRIMQEIPEGSKGLVEGMSIHAGDFFSFTFPHLHFQPIFVPSTRNLFPMSSI